MNELPDEESKALYELYFSELQKIPKDNLSFFFTDLVFLIKLAQQEDYVGYFNNIDIQCG